MSAAPADIPTPATGEADVYLGIPISTFLVVAIVLIKIKETHLHLCFPCLRVICFEARIGPLLMRLSATA